MYAPLSLESIYIPGTFLGSYIYSKSYDNLQFVFLFIIFILVMVVSDIVLFKGLSC